jgi:4-methylaminobutanoate oxidase (formaldehyde-forming)
VDGKPPSDVWEVDIRRFAPFTGNRKALFERTAETLGLHYAMRWPRAELETVRPLRTSPLYDLLAAKGAEFGSKNGWERVNYFRPEGASRPPYTLDKPQWLEWVQAEQRATREAVALYDQSSFSKLQLEGPDALQLLQCLCAADLDVPVGKMVYSPVLNDAGGFESDLTVIRIAQNRFWVITGSAQATRDADVIRREMQSHQWVVLTDISSMVCVLSVMGPQAPALMAKVSPDDLSPSALKFSWTREIDLGHARVRAARMSYVGGPGYELYVPVEMTRHVYLALHQAGADLGLKDAGYFAMDALRIESKRRAWGAEIGPDESPIEADMLMHVNWNKPVAFNGRSALQERLAQPLHKKLVYFELDSSDAYLWGGETVLFNGEPAGEITSTGWSYRAGRCVGMAYVRGAACRQRLQASAIQIELWGEVLGARAFELSEK